ncbi:hypothetical protein [Brevundimonas sp.]|uniref:hypothetical protein n=1 Tax=Brevundimonas sp. TaxID=1871086 RepID=UPI002FC90BF1
MRLSLTPFIALLASALSFLFAYMTEGMGFVPALFNLAGLAVLAWVVLIALQALYRLARMHRHSPAGPANTPFPPVPSSGPASTGASQKPGNRVKSRNQPGI